MTERSGRRPRGVATVIILSALALIAGRIMDVGIDGRTPFLSANDRSRWAHVAAMVDTGTHRIDHLVEVVDPVHRNRRPWNTIDKVAHRDGDGVMRQYSSKPPLMAFGVAGVYRVLRAFTGVRLTKRPGKVARWTLLAINLPLVAVFFWGTWLAVRSDDWSPFTTAVMAAAIGFGTLLTPMASSLNNHLVAAACIAAAAALIRFRFFLGSNSLRQMVPLNDQKRRAVDFGIGGSVALTAAQELPALSIAVGTVVLMIWADRRCLLPMLFGIGIVTVASFAATYAVHGSFRPPYAHRSDGELLAEIVDDDAPPISHLKAAKSDGDLRSRLGRKIADELGAPGEVGWIASGDPERLHLVVGSDDFAVLRSERGWSVRRWDDWYDYPGSHWRGTVRRGVDAGEPDRGRYAFHTLIGHHGVFSLTPMWWLMPIGLAMCAVRRPIFGEINRWLGLIAVATITCWLFYVWRPPIDRNYGGVSCGLRWLFWFAPLWFVGMRPAVDVLNRSRSGQIVLGLLVALSIASAATALDNPWDHPWLYQITRG